MLFTPWNSHRQYHKLQSSKLSRFLIYYFRVRSARIRIRLVHGELSASYNYKRTADSDRAGGYSFMWAKQIIGDLEGVFRGGQDFFDPQSVLSAEKGNFGVKKMRTPQKTSRNRQLCVLPAYKKIK
jgi:hypothetical protein